MLKVQDSVGRQAKGARTRTEAREMSQSNWHLCKKLQESLKSINKWPSRVLVALTGQKVKEQGNGKKMRVDKAMYHKEVEAERKVAENNKVDKLLPMPLPVTHDVQNLNK
jgi:hypothetical protein